MTEFLRENIHLIENKIHPAVQKGAVWKTKYFVFCFVAKAELKHSAKAKFLAVDTSRKRKFLFLYKEKRKMNGGEEKQKVCLCGR